MIESENRGLDIDIPRAALERMGYQLKVRYMPLARALMEVRSRRVDLMAPTFIAKDANTHLSEPIVWYRPTAFSLERNNLQIDQLEDLGDYTIMTFQGAKGYFGDIFIRASHQSPHYSEYYHMERLPQLLYAERTEVVILDFYIFQYFSGQLSKKHGQLPKLRIHEIFPRVPAAAAFSNPKIRDEFNQGLEKIKADGTYQAIIDQYSH